MEFKRNLLDGTAWFKEPKGLLCNFMFTVPAVCAAGGVASYRIGYAGAFKGNGELTRTPGSTGNRTTWDLSFWLHPDKFQHSTSQTIIAAGTTGTGNNMHTVGLGSNGIAVQNNGGTGADFYCFCDHFPGDVSDPVHVYIKYDSTQVAPEDRIKFRINGVLRANSPSSTYPTQNDTGDINSTAVHRIGHGVDSGSKYLHGLLSQFAFIGGGGTSVADFGEFNSTVPTRWDALDITGLTYTSPNSFLLDFADNTNLGKDAGGQGNHWTNTSSNVTRTANTPSNVHLSLNEASIDGGGSMTFSNNNKTVVYDGNSSDVECDGTLIIPQSGKYHFEVVCDALGSQTYAGIFVNLGKASAHGASYTTSAFNAQITKSEVKFGKKGSYGSSHGSFVATDRFAFDIDVDDAEVAISKNGTLLETVTSVDFPDGPIRINIFGNGGVANRTGTFRFLIEQDEFADTPASGHVPVSVANFASPTVKDPSTNHAIIPAGKTEANLATALSTARGSWTNYVEISKNLDSSETWSWRFSHDSSNEYAVSSTSTYQANRSLSGSDEWTGEVLKVDGTANIRAGSVSHTNGGDTAVSVTDMGTDRCAIFLFSRSGGDVHVYHPDLTSGSLLKLNSSAIEATDSAIKSVSSTGFTIDTGEATATYDYLIVPEISGFSRIGKHTGNNNADGAFFTSGMYRGTWISKSIDTNVSSWLYDNDAIGPYNGDRNFLTMETAAVLNTTQFANHFANGTKMLTASVPNYANDFIDIVWGGTDLKYGNGR